MTYRLGPTWNWSNTNTIIHTGGNFGVVFSFFRYVLLLLARLLWNYIQTQANLKLKQQQHHNSHRWKHRRGLFKFLSVLLLLARVLIWDCGCSGEIYNNTAFNIWVDQGTAPAIPATLKLYNFLKGIQFGVVLITGRPESQRAITTKNLLAAGYSNWTELILKYFPSHFHPPWYFNTGTGFNCKKSYMMCSKTFKVLFELTFLGALDVNISSLKEDHAPAPDQVFCSWPAIFTSLCPLQRRLRLTTTFNHDDDFFSFTLGLCESLWLWLMVGSVF